MIDDQVTESRVVVYCFRITTYDVTGISLKIPRHIHLNYSTRESLCRFQRSSFELQKVMIVFVAAC